MNTIIAPSSTSLWFAGIDQILTPNHTEATLAADRRGGKVSIQWTRLDPTTADAADRLRAVGPMLARAYIPVEAGFFRAHPDAIARNGFYKAIEPLLAATSIDWAQVEQGIGATLEALFADHFVKGLRPADLNVLVTVRNYPTDEILGALFFTASEAPAHVVRVTVLGVDPSAQGRGLGRMLMDAVAKIVSSAEKITLTTRVTNATALAAYRSWGFTEAAGSSQDWVSMEREVGSGRA